MSQVGLLGSRPARSVGIRGWWQSLVHKARGWIRGAVAPSKAQAVAYSIPRPFDIEVAPVRLQQDDTRSLGTHLLVELYECNPERLKYVPDVEQTLVRAAHQSNTHIVGHFFHEFQPHGVSGVVVIEESHYTVHTWPEERYAAVDLFYCSESVDAERALQILREAFEAKRVDVLLVRRGIRGQTPG